MVEKLLEKGRIDPSDSRIIINAVYHRMISVSSAAGGNPARADIDRAGAERTGSMQDGYHGAVKRYQISGGDIMTNGVISLLIIALCLSIGFIVSGIIVALESWHNKRKERRP